MSIASAPANVIHSYLVRIKGIDCLCPPGRSPYRIGNPVWAKPPNSRYTSNFKKGRVTSVVSEQSVSANGTPHHVEDLRSALEMTPLASDNERESPESELLIEPASLETNASPENLVTDQSESSSEEEVQAILLRRSTRVLIVTCVIMRLGGSVIVNGN